MFWEQEKTKGGEERGQGLVSSMGYESPLWLEIGMLIGAVPGNEAGERPHRDHDECLQGRDAPYWVSLHPGKITLVVK